MARAGTTLLCCVLLVAAGGLRLCCGIELLKGLKGQSLSFPPLHLESSDIARVTWWTQETHIAEAKPGKKMFSVDYLLSFRGRLLIHPTNLSLEIRPLKSEDSGWYKVIVDTFSDPTNPKTFSYLLMVHGGSTRTGGTGGHSESTEGPWGATEPCDRGTSLQGEGGEQPPDGSGGPEVCEVLHRYCVVKGYLVAAVFGPLLLLVAAIHVVTRDKAATPRDAVLGGAEVGSEPPGITASQGPSLWLR